MWYSQHIFLLQPIIVYSYYYGIVNILIHDVCGVVYLHRFYVIILRNIKIVYLIYN